MTAKEIIYSLPNRFLSEKNTNTTTIFHFEILGDNGGEFTIKINNGTCTVQDGLQGIPDCVIKTKDKIYEEIEKGKRNAQMAYMLGKIKISNLPLMMKFIGFFKRLNDTTSSN